MPVELWDALNRQSVVVTPGILFELREWLGDPRRNGIFQRRVLAAFEKRQSSVHLFDVCDFSTTVQAAAKYYIQLLCVRKLVASIERDRFSADCGREPTADELAARCKRITGERGWRLAEKGMNECQKINFGADEEAAVTWAVISAIVSGRETVIMTRDTDVMEQFYKLIYLLDTHYRSCLIACAFANFPSMFEDVSTSNMPGLWDVADPRDAVVKSMPYRFDQRVLPLNFRPVSVQCWLIGGDPARLSMSRLSFLAEREMSQVIRAKGSTGGKNTALLSGRNCHRCFLPHFDNVPADWFLIGSDRVAEFFGLSLPVVDVELSVRTRERTERLMYYKGSLVL